MSYVSGIWPVNLESVIPTYTGTGIDEFYIDVRQGSDNNNGKQLYAPLKTIEKAHALATDGRATVFSLGPGEYPESPQITKKGIAIIGSSGRHPGATVIGSNGTSGRATLTVSDDAARQFLLANLSITTAIGTGTALARPCLRIITNDSGSDAGANAADYHFMVKNVHMSGDGVATAGILLEGASIGMLSNIQIDNCVHGIVLTGSLNNTPSDLYFTDLDFWDNITADIATANSGINSVNAITLGSAGELDNVTFIKPRFHDVGGTPVTNYVNASGNTIRNVTFFDVWAARTMSSGTLFQGSTNMVCIGRGPAGNINFTV